MTQFDANAFNPYDSQSSEPAKTSLLAISGFVSSVIFCCPLTSLIGLLLGVGGLVSVSSSNGRRKGSGLASAAIIIAILSLVGQVVFIRMAAPYFKGLVKAQMFTVTGPTLFISDLEIGDLTSARAQLYPPFEKQISDGQLRYFATQIADRYGTVHEWQPVSQPPYNPTPGAEQTFDLASTLTFDKGSPTTTMKLTVSYGTKSPLVDQAGISGIVIHDSTLGDLTLSATSPSDEKPADQPKEPTGDTGGEQGGDGGGG